jgi:hypothetical protein
LRRISTCYEWNYNLSIIFSVRQYCISFSLSWDAVKCWEYCKRLAYQISPNIGKYKGKMKPFAKMWKVEKRTEVLQLDECLFPMKHRDLVQECFYVSRILGGSFISSCIQHHKVFLGISSTIANIGPSSIPLNFYASKFKNYKWWR